MWHKIVKMISIKERDYSAIRLGLYSFVVPV